MTYAPRFDWPSAEPKLRELWDAGKSAAEIAEAIGHHSRSAVLGKIHRLRLSPRRESTQAPAMADSAKRTDFDPNRADKLLRKFSWEEGA